MADPIAKIPVKTETNAAAGVPAPRGARPFESLRREVDRLFEDFDRDFWISPFKRSMASFEPLWRGGFDLAMAPSVDFVEKDTGYEVSVELPGMDEKNVEVTLANGYLTIKGEKQEEKEEKRKDYHLRERRFGSFERVLQLPESANADKISATVNKGVLTVTIPKKPEAITPEKKIEVKSAG